MELRYDIITQWKGKEDVRKAQVGLEKVGDASEKATPKQTAHAKSVGLMSGAVGKLVAGGVFIAAGRQVLQFGKESLEAASDVEEMQSKFNTVFGAEAQRVTASLGEFATAANRSKTELQGYAATLQDTFVPLGYSRDAAADMSVQLVKLAEDIASFNNVATPDVVRDLQSALVGNTETLRKYGVVAQETQIKQEALATGLWDGVGAIDAQNKAQAILQLTLKGTTDAQGDAIKTADSYENVSKGLEAAMLDLKVAIGQGLIPTMRDLKLETTGTVRTLADVWTASNQLRAAEEKGIISKGEYVRVQAKLTYGSWEAADVFEYLDKLLGDLDISQTNWQHSAGLTADEIERVKIETGSATDAAKQYNSELERLVDTSSDYYDKALNASDETSVLSGLLYEAAEAAGADAETLAILAIATGEYTREQAEAALQTAAMTVKAQELGAELAEGNVTIGEAISTLVDFQAQLAQEYNIQVDTSEISAAERRVQRLKDLLGSLGAARAIAPEVGDEDIGGAGGYVPEYAMGGVVPGPVGQPQLAIVHGGETIIPSGTTTNTLVFDFSNSVVTSQGQLRGWIQSALSQAGQSADVRIRT